MWQTRPDRRESTLRKQYLVNGIAVHGRSTEYCGGTLNGPSTRARPLIAYASMNGNREAGNDSRQNWALLKTEWVTAFSGHVS
ncbi:protein of unknown function (plasmid) [Caballeronia sp. S22]